MTEVKVMTDAETEVQTGDTIRVVVQDIGHEGDPIAFVDGMMTVIHTDDGVDGPGFAETARVKVADVSDGTIHAVYLGPEGE